MAWVGSQSPPFWDNVSVRQLGTLNMGKIGCPRHEDNYAMKLVLLLKMAGFSVEYKGRHITKPRKASLEIVLIPVSIRKKSRIPDIRAALLHSQDKQTKIYFNIHTSLKILYLLIILSINV
jgi:hypothetical protein